MPRGRRESPPDPFAEIERLKAELERVRRRRPRHIGSATPTGGYSGEVRVGNNKLWANDRGTWKSVAIA
jgi:hypothetical protein